MKCKKGLWSPDEDTKLRDYILNNGLGCWNSVPVNAGLQRNGKSCRLRWTNYLRPGLKRGKFTTDEEQIILSLHGILGNKWSQMSRHLPGRSDNEIKNHWHSHLKKKTDKFKTSRLKSTSLDAMTEDSSSVSSLKSVSSCLESSTDSKIIIPPKILFADWFTQEPFHSCDHDNSSVSGGALYAISSSQGTTRNGLPTVSNLNISTEVDIENDLNDLIFEENMSSYFNISDICFNP